MNPSNFRSGEKYAAYWNYNDGVYSNICATQGQSFLNRAAVAFGLSSSRSWDDAFQAQLISRVSALVPSDARWNNVLSALRQDAITRSVSPISLQTAIYLTYYVQNPARRFDAISIPSNAILPAWGVAPENDRNWNGGQLFCFDPSSDPDPIIESNVPLVLANSTTGVRQAPGRGPTGTPAITNFQSSGVVSPLTVFGVALLILGVGFAFARSAKK
jgi:hypothetical protein